MSTKVVRSLLADYSNHEERRAEAFDELLLMVRHDILELDDEDLLNLCALEDEEIPIHPYPLYPGENPSLDGAQIRELAGRELVRRDPLLLVVAAQARPDLGGVISDVLLREDAPSARRLLTRRVRIHWLSKQSLTDCSVNQVAALSLAAVDCPEATPLIVVARQELRQRGYRPPRREDTTDERLFATGRTRWGRSWQVSDRGFRLGETFLPAEEIQEVRSRAFRSFSGFSLAMLLFLGLMLPFLSLLLLLRLVRFIRKEQGELDWRTALYLVAGSVKIWGSSWILLGFPNWILFAYPPVVVLCFGVLLLIPDRWHGPLVLFPRCRRFTVRGSHSTLRCVLAEDTALVADGAFARMQNQGRSIEAGNAPL
jgi:hypothetical protein